MVTGTVSARQGKIGSRYLFGNEKHTQKVTDTCCGLDLKVPDSAKVPGTK